MDITNTALTSMANDGSIPGRLGQRIMRQTKRCQSFQSVDRLKSSETNIAKINSGRQGAQGGVLLRRVEHQCRVRVVSPRGFRPVLEPNRKARSGGTGKSQRDLIFWGKLSRLW